MFMRIGHPQGVRVALREAYVSDFFVLSGRAAMTECNTHLISQAARHQVSCHLDVAGRIVEISLTMEAKIPCVFEHGDCKGEPIGGDSFDWPPDESG